MTIPAFTLAPLTRLVFIALQAMNYIILCFFERVQQSFVHLSSSLPLFGLMKIEVSRVRAVRFAA